MSKDSNTQYAGLVAGAFLSLSAIFAKTAVLVQDDLQPSVVLGLSALSASCLLSAIKTTDEYRYGKAREFAKGLIIPVFATPLILHEMEEYHKFDENLPERSFLQDNFYSKKYDDIKNLLEERGITFPDCSY